MESDPVSILDDLSSFSQPYAGALPLRHALGPNLEMLSPVLKSSRLALLCVVSSEVRYLQYARTNTPRGRLIYCSSLFLPAPVGLLYRATPCTIGVARATQSRTPWPVLLAMGLICDDRVLLSTKGHWVRTNAYAGRTSAIIFGGSISFTRDISTPSAVSACMIKIFTLASQTHGLSTT